MKAEQIAKAIGDNKIGHVLIHYACNVKPFIQFDKQGRVKKLKTGATGTFNRIVEAVKDDPQFQEMLIEAVSSEY